MKIQDEYAMYLRKSRADLEAEARGEGDTLARHRAALRELAENRKAHVTEVYQEIVSGDTIAARPEMQKLLAEVAKGRFRGVLTMDVDRLARGDSVDQGIVTQTFMARGTLILTPYRTYDPSNENDQDFFEFKLFFARAEYKTIVRRMQAGRGASVKEGKYAGSIAPFGYERVKLERGKGYTLQIQAEQAQIVRMMFGWYVEGLEGVEASLGAIARRLNKMGVLTPRGGKWSGDGVGRILSNDLYRGVVTWSRRKQMKLPGQTTRHPRRVMNVHPIVARGLHPAIVSEAVFQAAQEKRARNRPISIRTDRHAAGPFTGLVVCAECGRLMRNVAGWRSRRASGLRCATPGCPTSGVKNELLERSICEILKKWTVRYEGKDALERPESPEAEVMKAHIGATEDQLRRVYDAFERGLYGDEIFISRRDALESRLGEARSELDRLISAQSLPEEPFHPAADAVVSVYKAYQCCKTPDEKNQMLRLLFGKIIFYKTKRCNDALNPAEYLMLDVYRNF